MPIALRSSNRVVAAVGPLMLLFCAAEAPRVSAQQISPVPPASPVPPGQPGTATGGTDAAQAPGVETPALRIDLVQALRAEPGGLTAATVARRAADSSPSVERARAAVRQAEEGASRAWLGVWPRLELSARYTRLSDVTQGSLTQSVDPMVFEGERALARTVTDPASQMLHLYAIDGQEQLAAGFSFPVVLNQYVFRAGLTYPVSDLFFSILPAHRAALGFVEASRVQIVAAREQVAMQAVEAFYIYTRARASMLVARLALSDVDAHRADVASFVEAGTVPRVELMRIDAQLAAARVGVARAEGGVAIAAEALRTLVHEPSGGPILIGEDVTDASGDALPPREIAMQRALAGRPEVLALERLAHARSLAVSARRGARLPHLAVAANAELSNPNQRVFPQVEEFRGTWDVSAVLSWSPNDLLSANTEVSEAEAEVAQARADLAALTDGVRIELAQAYEGITSAEQAVAAARLGIAAAEESYRVRLERYRAGASVTSDVLDAESELTRARLDFVNSAIDARVARMRLRRAMGAPLDRQ